MNGKDAESAKTRFYECKYVTVKFTTILIVDIA